jgi:hypothetical protein
MPGPYLSKWTSEVPGQSRQPLPNPKGSVGPRTDDSPPPLPPFVPSPPWRGEIVLAAAPAERASATCPGSHGPGEPDIDRPGYDGRRQRPFQRSHKSFCHDGADVLNGDTGDTASRGAAETISLGDTGNERFMFDHADHNTVSAAPE